MKRFLCRVVVVVALFFLLSAVMIVAALALQIAFGAFHLGGA